MIASRIRKTGLSIRLAPDLMKIIDELAVSEFEGNVNRTIVSLVQGGLKLKKFEQTIRDNPEKSDEIINEMNEKIENESVYDWLDNLTDRQKKGIVEYIQTTRD